MGEQMRATCVAYFERYSSTGQTLPIPRRVLIQELHLRLLFIIHMLYVWLGEGISKGKS